MDDERRDAAVHELEAQFSELGSRFRRAISENANRLSPGMLPAAYKVFTTIVRRGQATGTALADALMMDRGQLSRIIRELEALALIERTTDPNDKRVTLLTPTADGVQRLEAARAPQQGLLAQALEGWDVDDIESLARLLRAVSTGTAPSGS